MCRRPCRRPESRRHPDPGPVRAAGGADVVFVQRLHTVPAAGGASNQCCWVWLCALGPAHAETAAAMRTGARDRHRGSCLCPDSARIKEYASPAPAGGPSAPAPDRIRETRTGLRGSRRHRLAAVPGGRSHRPTPRRSLAVLPSEAIGAIRIAKAQQRILVARRVEVEIVVAGGMQPRHAQPGRFGIERRI